MYFGEAHASPISPSFRRPGHKRYSSHCNGIDPISSHVVWSPQVPSSKARLSGPPPHPLSVTLQTSLFCHTQVGMLKSFFCLCYTYMPREDMITLPWGPPSTPCSHTSGSVLRTRRHDSNRASRISVRRAGKSILFLFALLFSWLFCYDPLYLPCRLLLLATCLFNQPSWGLHLITAFVFYFDSFVLCPVVLAWKVLFIKWNSIVLPLGFKEDI